MQYLEYLDTLTATSSFPHGPLTTEKVFLTGLIYLLLNLQLP